MPVLKSLKECVWKISYKFLEEMNNYLTSAADNSCGHVQNSISSALSNKAFCKANHSHLHKRTPTVP